MHNAQPPAAAAVSAASVTASVSGNVLTIAQRQDYADSFTVRVTVGDGLASAARSFQVSVTNSAPTLTHVADQTMSHTQTTLSIPIGISDADGDPLTYSVQALAIDPLAQKAYNLDQQLGLYQWGGSYFTNLRGCNEKYLTGITNGAYIAYFVLPSGALYRWGGSIAASTLVDTLSPEYWADITKLHDAQEPNYRPVGASDVSVSVSGNSLTITRAVDYTNNFIVSMNVSDGSRTTAGTFKVSVTNSAPTLTHVADQTMSHTQTTLSIPLGISDADGDPLTYSVQALAIDPLAQKAYNLDQQLGLYQWGGSYFTNLRGCNEKYLTGITNGAYIAYFVLPSGALYRWGGSIAASTLVDTLSPEYWADITKLHDAQAPGYTPVGSGNVNVNVSGGSLTITRAAEYTNAFIVRVSVGDGLATATDTFKVSVTNSAPQLASIGDQVMPSSQTTLSLALAANDPDSDPLRYSATVLAADPLAVKAYNLDRQLGLYQWGGSYFTNLRGCNEKYLTGTTNGTSIAYFVLPSGALYRWGGSIAASTLVDTLSPAYWADITKLHNAQPPTQASSLGSNASASVAGNLLSVNRAAGYNSDFFVQVTVSDGTNTSSETFRVSATAAAALQTAALEPVLPVVAEKPSPAVSISSQTPAAFDSALAWLALDSRGLGATAGLSSSVENTVGQANRGTRQFGCVGLPRLPALLDSQVEHLLDNRWADVQSARADKAQVTTRRDLVESSLSANDEAAIDDLLAFRSTEQRVVDEIFDLLGNLE